MSRVEVPLTAGYVAIIDEEDLPLVSKYKWRAQVIKGKKLVYARAHVYNERGKRVDLLMHRLLRGVPKGTLVDHEDGNGLHNWRDNIRPANRRQNVWNRGKMRSNTSGFVGVMKRHSGWGYISQIRGENGKIRYLGRFRTKEDAAAAYDSAVVSLRGEFARANGASA